MKEVTIMTKYREILRLSNLGFSNRNIALSVPCSRPNTEGTVGNISTWITSALQNEHFFSLAELNRAIREKLEQFNRRLFQKKEGSRLDYSLKMKSRYFRHYLLPALNWVTRRQPPSSSIITYLWTECYTQFHMNTSKKSWCKGNRYHHWNFLQP